MAVGAARNYDINQSYGPAFLLLLMPLPTLKLAKSFYRMVTCPILRQALVDAWFSNNIDQQTLLNNVLTALTSA